MNYLPGQKIITTEGVVRTVALVLNGAVYVYGSHGWLIKVTPRGDAWGGEHDLEVGVAA